MKIKQFIEDNFLIDAPNGEIVEFKLNKVQSAYYDILNQDYNLESDDEIKPVREIILKARREGMTSFILALFASFMILSKHPIRFLEISYKEDATRQHFRRMKFFLESFFNKNFKGSKRVKYFETDNKNEIILKHNKASFYVGTASAKVGERGGTVQGILFSEAAYYPNSSVINASEIINASLRMVDVNSGLVFIESTGNGPSGFFYELFTSSYENKTRFKPRFFSWKDFYSEEEIVKIKSEFVDEIAFKREYPLTISDAFSLKSGLVYELPEHLIIKDPDKKDEILKSRFNKIIVGIDFGFKNPTAILIIGVRGRNYFVLDEIYELNKTNQDIIQMIKELYFKNNIIINELYPDPAEPDRIEELKRAGFNVIEIKKDVNYGINKVKSLIKQNRLFIFDNCKNLLNEFSLYSYNDKKDEPIKKNDHALDALRYAIVGNEDYSTDSYLWLYNETYEPKIITFE